MIPPIYLELVADAALKSYWRKKALRLFLRRCGVSETFLNSWQADESKRELLYRLFPKLEQSGDAGLRLVNRMADALVEPTTFPDLIGWEDSKEKIASAKVAADALRVYRLAQQAQASNQREQAEARKRASEIREEIRAKAKDLTKLEDELSRLALSLGTQQAGYDFEDWFYNLANFFEVPSRRPYKTNGRQIDGTITIDGTTYIVELKFTSEQSGGSDIDSLYKKITTKADNTMGVMFSISGYSSVAVREASGAKSVILLFDHAHLFMLLHGTMSLEELVCRVRRHSSQTGEAYLSAGAIQG